MSAKELFLCLPGLLLVSIWPALVHLDRVRTRLEYENWYPDWEYTDDYFMHVKCVALLFLAGWMLAALAAYVMEAHLAAGKTRHRTAGAGKAAEMRPSAGTNGNGAAGGIEKGPRNGLRERLYLPLMAGAVGLCFLSALVTPYRKISMLGLPESYETAPVILAYAVTCIYTAAIFRTPGRRGRLLSALIFGAFIQGLIGASQLAGHDFWISGAGRALVLLGNGQSGIRNTSYGKFSKVYLSFYNPNYAAVYITMVVPAVLAGFRKCISRRHFCSAVFCIVTVLLLFLSLFGTGSKSGLSFFLVVGPLVWLANSGLPRRKKVTVISALTAGLAVIVCAGLMLPGENIVKNCKKELFPKQQEGELLDLQVDENTLTLRFAKQGIRASIGNTPQGMRLYVSDADTGLPIHLSKSSKSGRLYMDDAACFISQKLVTFDPYVQDNGIYLDVWYLRKRRIHLGFQPDTESLILLNNAGKPVEPARAPAALKWVDDRILTGRMYIWKRTVPMLRKTFICGYGQETFPLVFPQNDFVAQANVNETIFSGTVTKPHSMYLQIIFNMGLLAFLCIAEVVLLLLRRSRTAGRSSAMRLGVIIFLLMGLLNDSTVAVTPIFCVMCGLLGN